uniref:hepatic and glial cell adhesion molecule-like n=1 Tax=Myxine glutinosa TaxID=7769 RepID=UPI00358EB74F
MLLLLLQMGLAARFAVALNVTGAAGPIRGVAGHAALLQVRYSLPGGREAALVQWRRLAPRPAAVGQWFAGEPLSIQPDFVERVRVRLNGSLEILQLKPSDEGIYQVEISITGSVESGHHSLRLMVDVPVSQPEVFLSTPVALELSDEVTLLCKHVNGSRPRYSWLKGREALVNSSRHQLAPDLNSLIIGPVELADSDEYRCHVENGVSGETSAPVLLTVYRRLAVYLVLGGAVLLIVTVITCVCLCCKPHKSMDMLGTLTAPLDGWTQASSVGQQLVHSWVEEKSLFLGPGQHPKPERVFNQRPGGGENKPVGVTSSSPPFQRRAAVAGPTGGKVMLTWCPADDVTAKSTHSV